MSSRCRRRATCRRRSSESCRRAARRLHILRQHAQHPTGSSCARRGRALARRQEIASRCERAVELWCRLALAGGAGGRQTRDATAYRGARGRLSLLRTCAKMRGTGRRRTAWSPCPVCASRMRNNRFSSDTSHTCITFFAPRPPRTRRTAPRTGLKCSPHSRQESRPRPVVVLTYSFAFRVSALIAGFALKPFDRPAGRVQRAVIE